MKVIRESDILAAIEDAGEGVNFERIRRITGYLSESAVWNDAKKAELEDRVKHGAVERFCTPDVGSG